MTDIRAQDAVKSDGDERAVIFRSERETTWRWEPSQPTNLPNAPEAE